MKNVKLYQSAVLLSTLGLALMGCKGRDPNVPAPIVDGAASSTDPASANLLPTQVAGVSYAATQQSSATSYPPQQQSPGRVTQNESLQYNTQPPAYAGDQQGQQQQPVYDQNGQPYDPNAQPNPNDQQAADAAEYDEYQDLLDPNVPAADQAPPPLPDDYEQPEAPGPDYIWTPGYWDYAPAGYYYVPGVWVAAPYEGALWTPGWWGFYNHRYWWHHGYWGRHVGYYGGINYGFGYIGFGYEGGYWNGSHFWYNTAVNRVRPEYVHNYVYNRRVEVPNRAFVNNSRASFAGPGGISRRPAPQELAARREQHLAPMQAQIQHRQQAMQNRGQFFNQNHGRPNMMAASHALAADHGITAPPRTAPPAAFNNTHPGTNGFNRGVPANATPQQRQQFTNQQRTQQEQQRNMNTQQRQQFEQQNNTQREQQRQRFGNAQNQQRQPQVEQQRQQAEQQQRAQQEQQRQQMMQQQRTQQEQQRQVQMQQQRTQQEQQRQQMVQQQRVQQEQQRQQMQVQRQQMQVQQHQQMQMQHAAPPQVHTAPAPQMHAAPAPHGGGGGEHRR